MLGDDVAAYDSDIDGLIDGVTETDVEGVAVDDGEVDGEVLERRDWVGEMLVDVEVDGGVDVVGWVDRT